MAIYYIDPINGKNENSGLSENEPILTNENLDVKPGDKVIAAKYAGTDIKLDNEEYTVLHLSDILAIVE